MTSTADPYARLPRRRLNGYNEHRGTRTGMSTWGVFLFGGAFVATGVYILLLGLRIVPADPSSVHAPYWVIAICGVCFASGGLAVWGMATTQFRDNRHRRDATRRFSGSAALADHAWDTRGFTPRHWGHATQAIVFALFFSLFVSVFNWWAWGAHGPVVVKIVVVVFDLILVAIWWQAVLAVGRAFRFGGSRLMFDHFPYRIDQPVSIRWILPRGIARADKGSVTFRCIEEYYEERGTGSDRSRWLVHDELCAETQSFDRPQDFAPGRPVDFRFEVPPGAPATKLSADRPVFWELQIVLSMPGLDFSERYLVPVYSA
jgi:hypothetical protein